LKFGLLPPEALPVAAMQDSTYVLGFDTSVAHCAAALVLGERLLVCRIEPMEKGQAERLMVLLSEVLAEAGISFRDLGAIGVGIGPGNFTGVRISVAAARGLALGLGIPAIGVSGFEAARFGLPEATVATLDARRDALWIDGAGISPQITTVADLPEGLAGRDVVGHRADEVVAMTGGDARAPVVPLPVAIARIAAMRCSSPQPRPAPLYLRAANAALPTDPPLVILP
jgi:tRNA threonylcarbamoyladenosine biosynthesis protein TsaB